MEKYYLCVFDVWGVTTVWPVSASLSQWSQWSDFWPANFPNHKCLQILAACGQHQEIVHLQPSHQNVWKLISSTTYLCLPLFSEWDSRGRWCCLPLLMISYLMLSLLWNCIYMTMDRRELLWKLIIIPTFQVSSMNGWSRETSTSCRNISDNTEAGEVSQFTQPHLMFTCAFTCSRIFTFSDVHDYCETCLNAAWN